MSNLLRVDEMQQPGKPRSLRQAFGSIRDFDELTQRFVFYTPLTCHLIVEAEKATVSTDLPSHLLAQYLREHPLVITDLSVPVLSIHDGLLVKGFHRSFCNKLYAVPREIWESAWDEIRIIASTDQVAEKLSVLIPVQHEIPNPLGSHQELSLQVYYYNCYGNKMVYYYEKTEESPVPRLCAHGPIREFSLMATRFFEHLQEKNSPIEKASKHLDRHMTEYKRQSAAEAARKAMRLQEKLARPLDESELNHDQRSRCRDIIDFYESIFGRNPKPGDRDEQA